MNKVMLMGRLTKDPEVRYTMGENSLAIARYTLAVNRRSTKGEVTADFITCVAFGKIGELAEKYLFKGSRVLITGRIQTGNYTNKEGKKVFTTEVIVEDQEFVDSKKDSTEQASEVSDDGFINIPEGIDEELPFR